MIRLVIVFLLFAQLAGATNYYVTAGAGTDTNTGLSAESAWGTLTASSAKLYAGDALLIDGTFSETAMTARAGTAIAPINLVGSSGGATIYQARVKYEWCNLSNLAVRCLKASSCAVWISTNNTRVVGCDVSHSGTNTRPFATITQAGTVPAPYYTNIYVGKCRFASNIYINIGLWCNASIVESNTICDTPTDAFNVWGENLIIRGNVVSNQYIDGEVHPDFIQTYSSASTNLHTHDVLIENNRHLNSFAQPCNLSVDNIEGALYGWIFRNNIFSDIAGNGNVGIPLTRWENNTFYRCATNDAGGNYPIAILKQGNGTYTNAFDGSGAVILNNIFVECGQSNHSERGFYLISTGCTTTVTSDYNYVSGFAENGYPAKSTNYFIDVHGVNGGDPLFVDSTNYNFHLQAGSTAIGAGTVLNGFTADIDGKRRGAVWDIGAYEYEAEPITRLRWRLR